MPDVRYVVINEYLLGQMFAESYRRRQEQNEATKAIQQVMRTFHSSSNNPPNRNENVRCYDDDETMVKKNVNSYIINRNHFNANYIKSEGGPTFTSISSPIEVAPQSMMSAHTLQARHQNGFIPQDKPLQNQMHHERLPLPSNDQPGQVQQHPPAQP
jgi:hypothetical protein